MSTFVGILIGIVIGVAGWGALWLWANTRRQAKMAEFSASVAAATNSTEAKVKSVAAQLGIKL